MTRPWVEPAPEGEREGWAHVTMSVGSEEEVRRLAECFAGLGLLESGPRWTGDGYFEAVLRAPGGLLVEITV